MFFGGHRHSLCGCKGLSYHRHEMLFSLAAACNCLIPLHSFAAHVEIASGEAHWRKIDQSSGGGSCEHLHRRIRVICHAVV